MFSIFFQLLSVWFSFHSSQVQHLAKSQITVTSGYKITVKINAYKDSTCYLWHHYGQYNAADDTATVDSKGTVVFDGKEPLPGGTYIVVFPDKKYFEFIINKEQTIYFETDTANITKDMLVKGSNENKLFYEYLNYINEAQKKYDRFKIRMENNNGRNDSLEIIKKEINALDNSMKDYKNNFIKKYPDTFISKIFIYSKDPDMPEIPLCSNGRKDSVFEYNYFKAHYWDNIDLTDDRIVRTPILYNKMNYYFDKVVIQHPDSICKDIDKLVEKAAPSKEVFKYIVAWLSYYYETSKIIGFDAVFVHLVDKYYATNQCSWLSPKLLDNMIKKANKLRPILLGKKAPNLIMQDTSLQLQSMYNVKAKYTILLFWDYECGHCKAEMPKIVDFYNQKKDELGLAIYSICTDTSMKEMKKFIRNNHMNFINVDGPRSITPHYSETYDIYSTPVIYLLDEDKIIVSKRIEVSQVEDIIKHDLMVKGIEIIKNEEVKKEPNQNPDNSSQYTENNNVIVKYSLVNDVPSIPIKVNGISAIDFTFDTGASETTVTADIVSTMIRQKIISKDDFLPGKTYILADGSQLKSPRFMIKTLEIGGIVLKNIEAAISSSNAEPLLGQNVFKRFKSFKIINDKKEIVIEN